MQASSLDFLKGKKTYIAAGILAFFGIGYFLSGHQVQGMPLIAQALGLVGLRRAIANLLSDAAAPK